MDIREVDEADLEELERIYEYYVENSIATFEETMERSTDFSQLYMTLRHAELPFIVAQENSILGYAFVKPYHVRVAYRYTVENSIYVHPDCLNRGIGRSLLESLIDRLRSTAIKSIIATISIMPDDREELDLKCRLHQSQGFLPVGRFRSVGYKFGKWIDVTYYQLRLGDRKLESE